ncbi:MAG: tripartite tricarboxylate transporter substrate binding protein [Betaproteobacteria bacterium]|nr:tripartite tricarboxylate transporter substrate binding protein [Betaproteobacteria bacterium]
MKSGFQMCSLAGIALVGIGVIAGGASAQSYPSKPVRIMVGFSAGGGTDVTARMLAQKLSEYLGQSVVVENRAGSGGMIATEAVAKAAPDGYTLLMVAAADVVQPAMRAKLSYDLERDFAPVSNVVVVPFALVTHPSVPARNVKELIALARTSPGRLNYASSGIGSSAHLSNELFNSMAKVKITHVPYKGVAEGVTALAAGQIEMIFGSFPATMPLYEARRIRMLAVSTLKRTSVMPELPTVAEAGVPGYERYGWYGVIAPAGVNKDVIARLNAGIVKVTGTPEMRETFTRQGLDPQTNTPEQFAAFIHSELVQTAKLIKASGAQAN